MSEMIKKGCIDMKIQAVLIDGFKNLANVRITFNNITALIALNDFGKSNVLSGIDFGLNFMKASIEDKKDMMSNSNLIPGNCNLIGRNYKYEMEVAADLDGREYLIQYGYEFEWKDTGDKEPGIVSEFLKVKPNEKGQKYTQLINRTADTAFYKSSETGRCSSMIKVEETELVVNKLRAYDELYYALIITKLNGIKINMGNNLETKNFCQSDSVIRKGFDNASINEDNLPRVIYKLKSQYPDKFALLKDAYFQLFPEFEEIIVNDFQLNVEENHQLRENALFLFTIAVYALFVKRKGLVNPVNFSMISDGARRVFMILTQIITASVSNISLIAIEEPDNSVYPGLFGAYIRIISQLSDDCKVIITSHSPYFVSCLDPSGIHVGINRKAGVAEFFPFKKSGQKQLVNDAVSLDLRMGEYLFSMLADSESNIRDYLEWENE